MGRLTGRVIIVTGGASGLGEGIVRRAAEEGGTLVIADLNGDKAEALAASLHGAGQEAMGIAVDVAERAQVRAMVAAAASFISLSSAGDLIARIDGSRLV